MEYDYNSDKFANPRVRVECDDIDFDWRHHPRSTINIADAPHLFLYYGSRGNLFYQL